jgi:hypothetical protein
VESSINPFCAFFFQGIIDAGRYCTQGKYSMKPGDTAFIRISWKWLNFRINKSSADCRGGILYTADRRPEAVVL